MVTMKFALVSLTLIVLLDAYNARHLHDASVKRSFDGRSLFYGVVIQMTTGEKLWLPEPSRLLSLVDDHHTTYGRVKKPPPPPFVAPSKGQATYGRVKSSPPPPIVAPSKGQETYTRVNSSPPPPNVAPSKGQETYTRVKSSPPPPIVAPSKGQETYGGVNPLPYVVALKGQETLGRDDPRSPPSLDPNGSQRQGMYDRVNPSAPSATKLVDPTHPLLSDGAGFSISNEDRWHLLPSYIIRVFRYWG